MAGQRPAVKVSRASAAAAQTLGETQSQRLSGPSRLKLDPLELFSDRIASLDTFMTFSPTEDVVRTVQKIQTLETDVKALRVSAAINEANLKELKARLQMAQAQRFPMELIYALIAAVLVCLAAVAYLLYRQRRDRLSDNDWWTSADNQRALIDGETEPGIPFDAELSAKALQESKARKTPRANAGPGSSKNNQATSEIDVSMVEMSHSTFDQLMESGGSLHAAHKRPPASALGAQSGLALNRNAEALLDIGHQVELLVSLGKTERAIALLKKLIHDSAEPYPSTYLDLLGLLHSLGLKTEFQQTRAEFSRLFNGRVAEFSVFRGDGKSLESYPEVLSRIAALWPRPEVRAFIGACILRDPRHPEIEPFDLAAFRDLLLLHAIVPSVRHRPRAKDDAPRPTLASSLSAPVDPQADFPRPGIANPELLDLDLSDSEVDGPQPASVTAPGVDIPLLISGVDEEARQPVNSAPTPVSDDLLNFDLPESPKLLKPDPSKAS
jgi:hypothetical protein